MKPILFLRQFFRAPTEAAVPARSAMLLFIATYLIYLAYLFIMQREWLLGGEMWAEAASSYYFKANSASLWTKFLTTEAGYLPLAGRLIAALLQALHVPATYLGYFYNWLAVLIGIAVISAFALPRFRPLVPDDLTRSVLSFAFLLLIDFQTLTFINFTHCGIILCTAFAALALLSSNEEVEDAAWWAWLFLIFIVSKPYYLCLFPVFVVAAFIAKPRYRLLMMGWALATGLQAVQLLVSLSRGVMSTARVSELSLIQKVKIAILHAFGFIGSVPLGPVRAGRIHTSHSVWWLIAIGLFFCAIFLYSFIKGNGRTRSLILAGACLIFGTCMINVFALTHEWNGSFTYLKHFWLYRHILPGYFGFLFMVCGVLLMWKNRFPTIHFLQIEGRNFSNILVPVLFAIWFLWSGWLYAGMQSINWPEFPYRGASSWRAMANVIDHKPYPLCVPLNPYPWRVEHGCGILNVPEIPVHDAPMTEFPASWDVPMPKDIAKEEVMGIALVVSPAEGSNRSVINGTAEITLKSGEKLLWRGVAHSQGKGILYMTNDADHLPPTTGIKSVKITLDKKSNVAAVKKTDGSLQPAPIWYGVKPNMPDLEKELY